MLIWIRQWNLMPCYLQEIHLNHPKKYRLKLKDWKTTIQHIRKGGEAIFILDKIHSKDKNVKEAGTLLKSFFGNQHHLITKPDRDITKKGKFQISISDAKIPNKILANRLQKHIKCIIYHNQVGIIPGIQE